MREPTLRIALTTIGAGFARLYWNRTIVFLRQAAVLSKEPEVIKSIRTFAEHYRVRKFSDFPKPAHEAIVRDMARILRINVLRAFHTSKPLGAAPLYTWNDGEDEVRLTPEALELVGAQNQAPELRANYWWARYLEKVNRLAPAIIEKVSRDGARRTPLSKYLAILRSAGEDRCFYCDRPLDGDLAAAVDHVLPWSFLLGDPLWDSDGIGLRHAVSWRTGAFAARVR